MSDDTKCGCVRTQEQWPQSAYDYGERTSGEMHDARFDRSKRDPRILFRLPATPLVYEKENSVFVTSCHVLDIHAQGSTETEARIGLSRAITMYIRHLHRHGILDKKLRTLGFSADGSDGAGPGMMPMMFISIEEVLPLDADDCHGHGSIGKRNYAVTETVTESVAQVA